MMMARRLLMQKTPSLRGLRIPWELCTVGVSRLWQQESLANPACKHAFRRTTLLAEPRLYKNSGGVDASPTSLLVPLPEKAGLMHPAHAAAAPLQPPDGTLQAFHIIQTRARVNHLSQTHEAPRLKRTPCPEASHVEDLRAKGVQR